MKVKTHNLKGAALDWAVNEAQSYNTSPLIVYDGCEGEDRNKPRKYLATEGGFTIDYSNWAQGGPIIERENITLDMAARMETAPKEWGANCGHGYYWAPTPLIAAMRCYVASKLGDEIEIPEELCA